MLGCGGLGSGVAMGLCRLGVRKLILVDVDTVDATNLNRQVLPWEPVGSMDHQDAHMWCACVSCLCACLCVQVLFTKEHLGMRKVDVRTEPPHLTVRPVAYQWISAAGGQERA